VPDIDDQLRELFQRRADDVPAHDRVPPSLVSRGRRRFTLNAMGVGLGVVLVAAGAIAGMRGLSGLPAPQPVGSTPPPTHPTPSSLTPSACTSAQLRAVASLSAAAGSREGAIAVTNRSSAACTLEGTPGIRLLDQNLRAITSGLTFSTSPSDWEANGHPEPAGWPTVTLQPGDAASFRLRWGNWCPQGRPMPTWRIAIPGGGTVDVGGFDASDPPPCNGGATSTIEEGPFEPNPSP
jgi:Protein of unknown function (DUF4232)